MTAKKRKAKTALASQLAPFDVSRHLSSDAVIAEYLAAALEDPNPDKFLRAVANVAKARGMASVAEASLTALPTSTFGRSIFDRSISGISRLGRSNFGRSGAVRVGIG